MLRRAPTVLTLTGEDLLAYENSKKDNGKPAPLASTTQPHPRSTHLQTPRADHPHHQQQHQQVNSDTSSSSSSYEEVSENPHHHHHHTAEDDDDQEEASYFPRRYRTIEDMDENPGAQIYRNEVERQTGGDAMSDGASSGNTEDQVMAELAPEAVRERDEEPPSRFGRRGAAAATAVTPTVASGGRAARGAGSGVATPEAPVRQTRSREERIMGRGGRR